MLLLFFFSLSLKTIINHSSFWKWRNLNSRQHCNMTCGKLKKKKKIRLRHLTLVKPSCFFVTRLTKGVVATVLWTWKINAWGICLVGTIVWLWVSFFHTYQKSSNILCLTSQWRHNCRFCPIWRFQCNICQNWIFCQKVLNIGSSPVFLLIKEGIDIFNIYCNIQDHTMEIFFKLVISNIAGLHPHPLTLTAYLTPGKVVGPTPNFFSSKWPQRIQKKLPRCPRSLSVAF